MKLKGKINRNSWDSMKKLLEAHLIDSGVAEGLVLMEGVCHEPDGLLFLTISDSTNEARCYKSCKVLQAPDMRFLFIPGLSGT